MVFFRKSEEERPPRAAQELVDLRAAVQKARLPEAVAAVAVKNWNAWRRPTRRWRNIPSASITWTT